MQEKFEDTKWVIRNRKSRNSQYIDQQKRDKRANNDLQNITQKTKDRVTRTPVKNGNELRYSGMISRPSPSKKLSGIDNTMNFFYYVI